MMEKKEIFCTLKKLLELETEEIKVEILKAGPSNTNEILGFLSEISLDGIVALDEDKMRERERQALIEVMEFTFGGDRKKIKKIWEEREQQDASNVLSIDFAKILKGEEVSIEKFWDHAGDYFDARDEDESDETLKTRADDLANSIASTPLI